MTGMILGNIAGWIVGGVVIVLLTVAGAVLWWASWEEKQKAKTLEEFEKRLSNLWERGDLVGESTIQAFMESERPVLARFDTHCRWFFQDKGLQERIKICSSAGDILRQHDAEILFNKRVVGPLRDMLASPEHIAEDSGRTLAEEGRFHRERMEICEYCFSETGKGVELFEHLAEQIRQHNEQIDAEIEFAETFVKPFKALLFHECYLAHSQWTPLKQQGEKLGARLTQVVPLRPETRNGLRLLQTAERCVNEHNMEFAEREAKRCASFFDSLTKYPLDRQQRNCCIVDEDAALVIAGAGSGKTSVIMAKVAYLLKQRGVRPEEILLISFTNKAAQEMTTRIAACIGRQSVAASTFHKFGMKILQLSGKEIADADFLKHIIHEIMTGEADFVEDGYSRLAVFAGLFSSQEQLEDVFANENKRVPKIGGGKKITLAGEQVKSEEELLIANFLFLKGVRYEYEKPYPKPYEGELDRKKYRPDFYLPAYDIYLEHYGVDEQEEPAPWWPRVEREKYKAGMQWKRELHAKAGNRYIESFSWWHHKGMLLEKLEETLKAWGVQFCPKPAKEVLGILRENEAKKLSELEKLIVAFIQLYKSNNYSEKHFDSLGAQREDTATGKKRKQTFVELVRQMYRLYQRKLAENKLFDFNDMINRATDAVWEMPHGTLPYKYVVVDEYQDATVAQMKLLKSVLSNTGAHLFCVGDDWQSIYRFNGSDLSLFTDFEKYFGSATIKLRLENTYRNSQELTDIMSRFILRNPKQLPKNLKSARHCANPVRVVWYSGSGGIASALEQAIKEIAADLAGEPGTVLLLGRNQYDEKLISTSGVLEGRGGEGMCRAFQYPNIRFQFLTVHKSKGLEADSVILLNATDDLLGFPTQIADDPILQLVQHGQENYPFAEERRLFYVALTRTRNKAFVLAPEEGYSTFVEELVEWMGEKLPKAGKGGADGGIVCPKCQSGILISREGKHGWFTRCANAPECDWKTNNRIGPETPRCPECGGFLVARWTQGKPPFLGCTNYPLCRYHEELPQVQEQE